MARSRSYFSSFKRRFSRRSAFSLRNGKAYHRTQAFITRRPLAAFLLSLALLFGIIALGSFLQSKNKTEPPKAVTSKAVQIYSLGTNPTINVQAKVEKVGVIRIVAQSPGIVSRILVKEGDSVKRGGTLIQLGTNYQGANAPALQAQIAQKQYNNTAETYDAQKELVAKQREVADKTEANAEELRKIAESSANDTQGLLELNQDILDTLSTNLTQLENSNTNGANDQLILQTQQLKSQVQSGVVQLQAQVKNLNYQKDTNKPPAELGRLQRDIAKKQLDIQEKALTLGLEVSRLQRDLAWVQASLMSPSAPCGGTVERINVKPGDAVNPGEVLATIKTENNEATLEALLPSSMAEGVSLSASSSATIKGKTFQLTPYYVSGEATSGQLYSVLFTAPEKMTPLLTDGQYIVVTIPIGTQTTNSNPYVPLDAIYQTEDEAYLYVVEGNKAMSRKVTLGDVYGKFVVVTSGIRPIERIILNRNVVTGDTITTQ